VHKFLIITIRRFNFATFQVRRWDLFILVLQFIAECIS